MVAADVTSPDEVARVAEGHNAVLAAVYDEAADPTEFLTRTAKALAEGVGWRLAPAGDFDHDHPARSGSYRLAPADSRISYADLAIALLDEIDTPRHHRVTLGAERG